MLLVAIVVYIFLQGWRATLIPLLAVPVSLIGTFVFFPLFGFSINTLSLFGLVLAIGLVVDDAIVVVEAVERHIEEGLAPKSAALKAMEEISGPRDRHRAGSLGGIRADGLHPRHHRTSLSAVRGDHRDLGDPLGVQRADAQPGAGRAAAQARRPRAAGRCGRFFDWFNRVFGRATDGYVRWSRHPDPQERRRAGDAGAVFGDRRGVLQQRVPSSFLPDEDQGYMYMHLQLPNAASLERTDEAAAQKVEKILLDTPGVKYTTSVVGFSLLSFVRTSYNGVLLRHARRRGTIATAATSSIRRSCST